MCQASDTNLPHPTSSEASTATNLWAPTATNLWAPTATSLWAPTATILWALTATISFLILYVGKKFGSTEFVLNSPVNVKKKLGVGLNVNFRPFRMATVVIATNNTLYPLIVFDA